MVRPITTWSTINLVSLSLLLFRRVACRFETFVDSPLGSVSVVGDGRIVGGEEAEEDRYPYLASVVTKKGRFFCAGTLVHPEWVLSAAHCAGHGTHVILGHHNLSNATLHDFVDAERVKIRYEVVHPRYHPGWVVRDDLAMIRLWDPVTSVDPVTLRRPSESSSDVASRTPSPFCRLVEWFEGSALWFPVGGLPSCRDDDDDDDDLAEGTNVTAVGWGQTAEDGDESDVPREVDLAIVDRRECNDLVDDELGGLFALVLDLVTDGALCARPAVRTDVAGGVCRGDSGGPVLVKGTNASEDVQVGVVSWIIAGSCGDPDLPDVSMDVSRNADFVEETMARVDDDDDDDDCDFPDDGHAYHGCLVPRPCWLNDGVCDGGEYNTSECRYDGLDCAYCDFPDDDGFDYSECEADNSCRIGDGVCDHEGNYRTAACNFDAGDCCRGVPLTMRFWDVQLCLFERFFLLLSLLH